MWYFVRWNWVNIHGDIPIFVGAYGDGPSFGMHFAIVIRGIEPHGCNDTAPLYSSRRAFVWCVVRLNWGKNHGDTQGYVEMGGIFEVHYAVLIDGFLWFVLSEMPFVLSFMLLFMLSEMPFMLWFMLLVVLWFVLSEMPRCRSCRLLRTVLGAVVRTVVRAVGDAALSELLAPSHGSWRYRVYCRSRCRSYCLPVG